MRKWLSSLGYILIALFAIFLLTPLALGLLAEKKCKQIANIINTTTPFKAKIINYQRGWFGASATALISLDQSNKVDKELQQLEINASIIHGPMLIDWVRFHFIQALIKADITLNEAQNDLLKRSKTDGPIANTNIKFRLVGDTVITLDSQPLHYEDGENTLNWKGLRIKTVYSPLYNKVDSKINAPGLDIKTKNFKLNFKDLASNYQGNKTSNDTWIGERKLKLASAKTKNRWDHAIALDGLNIDTFITEELNDSVNIKAIVVIDNLNINEASYDKNKLVLKVAELKQNIFASLQQQLISNKTFTLPKTTVLDIIMSLLNNGGKVHLKELNTNTPWGRLFASMKVSSDNQTNDIGIFATILNSTVHANIKTELALILHLLEKFYKIVPTQKENNDPAKQAKALLKDWQHDGKIITSDKDDYLYLNFDYKDGQPSINNKSLILSIKP